LFFNLVHIRQKLLAIKPSACHEEPIKNANNKYCVHYDVYYPDNDVPKTSRPAPDFRVIVFEYAIIILLNN